MTSGLTKLFKLDSIRGVFRAQLSRAQLTGMELLAKTDNDSRPMAAFYRNIFPRCLVGFSVSLQYLPNSFVNHFFFFFLPRATIEKLEPETTFYFLLSCHLFQVEKTLLLNDINEIGEHIISDNTSILDQILLYGNKMFIHATNKKILLSTIKYWVDSKIFDMPLL